MKNKFLILILFCFFFIKNLAFADQFKFETKNLEILKEKNIILAGKGKAYSLDGDLEINSDEFIYEKDLKLLTSKGNGLALIKQKNIQISFNKATFDQKKFLLKADGNVKIVKIDKNLVINSNAIIYDYKNHIIKSVEKTILKDSFDNTYTAESFVYEIKKNILKLNDLILKDNKKNIVSTKLAFINTKSGKLFGKDIDVSLNNIYFNKDNDPRLKGNSLISDDNITQISKGVFTTCKKRDGCPPWHIKSKKIIHDKNKKTINYENAFLSIYDFPVMYFPKFFHPDPTVKRRSGFLIPGIKNSQNSDNFLSTPYFFAIAENKDATFNPRFYPGEKILLQTEYRQKNSRSNHIADFSFFSEKNKNTKNHFFYEFDKDLNINNFNESEIKISIQNTSNDTYLRSHKIKSEIVNDKNILQNSIDLNLYANEFSLNMNSTVYEDLDKNDTDRYEYILPNINLLKKINNKTNLNGNFYLKSQGLVRNYDTNVTEKTNTNDIIFKSYPKINSLGFSNNYEFVVRNSNSDNENTKYKNNENIYLSSIYQYNSTLPLLKENKKFRKILKPKISFKIAPNHTKDERNGDAKIDINNIYSINRLGGNNSIEGGTSITYGGEYSIVNKQNSLKIIDFKIASNLRFDENDDLPNNHQIGEKTSNFFNELIFNPNEFFKTQYVSSLRNNLKDYNYENIITEFKINKFVTEFDYLNENNSQNQNSYLSNKSSYLIDDSNSLSFKTRKNKTLDLTEYYELMYQYKNDCLAASVEYSKNFYSDRDLKPDESLFFKLTIIPFGETSSPNLNE